MIRMRSPSSWKRSPARLRPPRSKTRNREGPRPRRSQSRPNRPRKGKRPMTHKPSRGRIVALLVLFLTAPALPAADGPAADRPEPPPRLRKKKDATPPAEEKAPDKKPDKPE